MGSGHEWFLGTWSCCSWKPSDCTIALRAFKEKEEETKRRKKEKGPQRGVNTSPRDASKFFSKKTLEMYSEIVMQLRPEKNQILSTPEKKKKKKKKKSKHEETR